MSASGAANSPPVGARRWLRPVGTILGLALIAGALVAVARERDAVESAFASIAEANPLLVAGLAGCVAANLILSGAIFSSLIARFGRVGRIEMQALIAATTLLNFLPLRPGLPGRIAYHRAVNGIPVRHGTRVVIEALAASLTVAALLALTLLLGAPPIVAAIAPPVALALAAVHPAWRPVAIAAIVRHVDVLAWAGRYWCAFALVGAPIEIDAALALACVGVLATLVPFVSNGLGVREWAVGLLAPALAGVDWELGVAADLVNRAVELGVVVPAGLAGVVWLWRRRPPV